MKPLITKLIKILDGKEGPKWQGNYEEDARYTYPQRIALARGVAIEIERLLINQSSRPDGAECDCHPYYTNHGRHSIKCPLYKPGG